MADGALGLGRPVDDVDERRVELERLEREGLLQLGLETLLGRDPADGLLDELARAPPCPQAWSRGRRS